MELYENARRAIEQRLSDRAVNMIYRCVGLSENFENATIDVFDQISQDDYTISCKVKWISVEGAAIERISWK